MAESTCSVEDCDGVTGVPGTAKGLCSKHYYRQLRTGDVNTVRKGSPGKGAAHHSWKGADATYTALHNRVYRARGKANHCDRCGADDPAKRYEWAMLHGTDGTDVHEHYMPMCQHCHRTYDVGKLTLEQRQEIRERVAAGESQTALAEEFRIDKSVISRGLSDKSPKWGSAA